MPEHEVGHVSKEAFEMALAQADTYRNLLYTVTPALVAGMVFLFLRLQAFGERCAVALEKVGSIVEALNHGKER